ncbi:hypothetical protein BJ170DRAFT_47478 [Xylariales sp. AK1849]|nr:hypothetical protein BJ170DRAFT_47478 [Xylariales sp. AK1849]
MLDSEVSLEILGKVGMAQMRFLSLPSITVGVWGPRGALSSPTLRGERSTVDRYAVSYHQAPCHPEPGCNVASAFFQNASCSQPREELSMQAHGYAESSQYTARGDGWQPNQSTGILYRYIRPRRVASGQGSVCLCVCLCVCLGVCQQLPEHSMRGLWNVAIGHESSSGDGLRGRPHIVLWGRCHSCNIYRNPIPGLRCRQSRRDLKLQTLCTPT